MVSAAALKKIAVNDVKIGEYLDPLNKSMAKYGINSSLEVCHFLAQILHESGRFLFAEEIADGSAYEGRADLGNNQKGDGVRFKGRGLIQLTGRSIYQRYGKYVGFDFIKDPKKLKELPYSVDSACWFFAIHKRDFDGNSLPKLAEDNNFIRITYTINGGFNGLRDRLQIFASLAELYISDYDVKMEEIYCYVKTVVDEKPNNPYMRGALFRAVPTYKDLDNLFHGLR